MKITISTNAKGGHLICYLINSNGIKILSLKDTDTATCMLVLGNTYRFEWHVWSATKADYKIDAIVVPVCVGFPDFNWKKNYKDSHQDMGGFYFTV